MNDLLNKYNDYLKLAGCTIEYELEDKTVIIVPYREDGFLHLLGIHKLTDIQLIQFWLDKNNRSVKREDVIRKIKAEELTDSDIRNSVKFCKIKDRYEHFSYDNLTTVNYTDAIINFDAKKKGSYLKADYILFEERPKNEYNHMAIAMDKKNNCRYIESFFHEPSADYQNRQIIKKIVKFSIRKSDGSILVSDTFEYNKTDET